MNRVSSVSSSRRALRSSIPKSVTVTPCAHWWTPLASSLPPADGCPLHDAQKLMPLRPFRTVWPSTPHFRTWESAVDGNPHPHGHPQLRFEHAPFAASEDVTPSVRPIANRRSFPCNAGLVAKRGGGRRPRDRPQSGGSASRWEPSWLPAPSSQFCSLLSKFFWDLCP